MVVVVVVAKQVLTSLHLSRARSLPHPLDPPPLSLYPLHLPTSAKPTGPGFSPIRNDAADRGLDEIGNRGGGGGGGRAGPATNLSPAPSPMRRPSRRRMGAGAAAASSYAPSYGPGRTSAGSHMSLPASNSGGGGGGTGDYSSKANPSTRRLGGPRVPPSPLRKPAGMGSFGGVMSTSSIGKAL